MILACGKKKRDDLLMVTSLALLYEPLTRGLRILRNCRRYLLPGFLGQTIEAGLTA